jgi:uncharacterized protein
MIKVKFAPGMGRGVFATQNIKTKTRIHSADFIKVKDSEMKNCHTLEKYVFTYSKNCSAMCLGVGPLFNHSEEPNVEVIFEELNGREMMSFFMIKEAKRGEQLFISYGGEEYAFYHSLKKNVKK